MEKENKKYMNIDKKNISKQYLNFISLLIVADVMTTLFLLLNEGQELNIVLLWLVKVTSISLISTVLWTHIVVLLIIAFCKHYIKKVNNIECSIMYMILGVFIIYMFVVLNNLIAIGIRI